MKKIIYHVFICLLLFHGCINVNERQDPLKSEHKLLSIADRNKSINSDSIKVWANKDLDIQGISVANDTLKFIIGSWFLWYPFGKFSSIDSFHAKYRKMHIKTIRDTTNSPEGMDVYIESYGNSVINLVENEDRIEIVYAMIADEDIVFTNGLKIGCTKDVFLKKFFTKSFPTDGINNIKVISVLEGIYHNYHFDNDAISSIEIDTDYQLNKTKKPLR